MKAFITIGILLLYANDVFCQQWTNEQLQNANTAADEYQLTNTEKEVIQYINLCRLYPALFAEQELKTYNGLPGIEDRNFENYKASLAKTLATMQPCTALKPDELLYDDARCYGNEISKNQRKPHERIDCIKRNYAECIYYGSGNAKHIAMQWLIDSGIETLGHRRICLLPAHHKIGIKVNAHFEYGYCTVAEFAK
ncbi:MAG: hypothetical protein IPP72_21200 [Chitinophagaceae bacterium]|nr:hypothetical protein [Chitinophagaceae bacterium]